MKIKDILAIMYDNEEEQLICIQDPDEKVFYIGTVAEYRRSIAPKDIQIITMFTERLNSYHGQSALTIVI